MTDQEIRNLNFEGWPLPDEWLIELGRIAGLWGALESLLNVCIGKLAGFNDRGDPTPFILVNHVSFPQKLDILGALCENLTPEFPHLSECKTTIGLLRNAQKFRNKFMHHGIALNSNTREMEMPIASARGTLKTEIQRIKLVDIRRTSIAINGANRALYKLVLQRDLPPAGEVRGS